MKSLEICNYCYFASEKIVMALSLKDLLAKIFYKNGHCVAIPNIKAFKKRFWTDDCNWSEEDD